MTVPVANPGASYKRFAPAINEAIHQILDSGWYILGNACKEFEKEFAAFCGTLSAIGVANGTDAVELSLRGVGTKPGDKVITVANTAVATVAAIERAGCHPLFADVTLQDQVIDPVALENLLINYRDQITAIVAVHLFGSPCDMRAINQIAAQHNIAVIEDCAQAHGASVSNKLVGSLADCGAFSFYPTKNLGAIGDGGAVVTNSQKVADRIRLLQQYGWQERYISKISGFNSRLDELQAAILSVKLKVLAQDNQRRQKIASYYNESFQSLPLTLPSAPPYGTHVYHQYVIQCEQRDALQESLRQQGVGSAVLYPLPIHKQPAYVAQHSNIELPVTEQLARRILALPVYPELSDIQVEQVANAVHNFYKTY